MSKRDHYRGARKSRDVYVDSRGNLYPLDIVKSEIFPNGSKTEVLPTFEMVTWYVRPNGDDRNDGKSSVSAFATIERAFQELRTNVVNLAQRIDITGMKGANTITKEDGTLRFPPIISHIQHGFDLSNTGPDSWIYRSAFQLVAEMDKILDVTINSITSDSTTGLVTITVNETLTPNAHAGQMLIGDGLVEHGTIVSNTSTDLVMSTDKTSWTSPAAIYEYGAEIRAGDPNDGFASSGSEMQALSSVFLSGVKFSTTSDSKDQGLALWGPGRFAIHQCDFAGLSITGTYSGAMDACHVHAEGGADGNFLLRNVGDSSIQVRHTFVDTGTFEWDTAWVICITCWFENAVTPVARTHGVGNLTTLDRCQIKNAQGVGVRSRYANHLGMSDCRVDGSGSHGVEILGGAGAHTLDNVQGSGNGGYGTLLRNGAQVDVSGGTTISGSSGEVRLGQSGATTWSSAPNTDVGETNPEFCRIG